MVATSEVLLAVRQLAAAVATTEARLLAARSHRPHTVPGCMERELSLMRSELDRLRRELAIEIAHELRC
jgi:hypothetical protein